MKRCFILLLSFSFITKMYSQVNLQTGSAVFGLPIFDWKDDKSNLNLSISINYNSGNGLKTDEVASNIGQGWSLIAGGVISRMQVGEPDDQKPNLTSTPEQYWDWYKYPAGYLYSNADPRDGVPKEVVNYPLFKDKNHIYKKYNSVIDDKELDYFMFQFNGRSGMFILDKSHNTDGDVCAFIGDSKLKGWFERDERTLYNMQIRTTISAFNIQDENGLIYKFANLGWARILRKRYFDASLLDFYTYDELYNTTAAYQTQPTFKKDKVYHEGDFYDDDIQNPNVVNEWHLTEINDPATGRTIHFNYKEEDVISPAGTSLSYYDEGKYAILSHKFSYSHTCKLVSINCLDQNPGLNHHVITFTYGNERADLKGDKILSSIDIKYGQGDKDEDYRYLSKYTLTSSYFIRNRYGTPKRWYELQSARLCLLSIKKTGIDLKEDNPPYLFDYYTSTGTGNIDDVVPQPFSPYKDIWGFYNGDNSADADNRPFHNDDGDFEGLTKTVSELSSQQIAGLCFLRNNNWGKITYNSKPGYAKNGLLRQIVYPTGGSMQYDYIQNEGKTVDIATNVYSANMYVGGVHISQVRTYDGGYSNGCDNPLVTNYRYNTDMTNTDDILEEDNDLPPSRHITSSLSSYKGGIETPNNKVAMENDYTPEGKKFHYDYPFSVKCIYKYQYPGILAPEDMAVESPSFYQEIISPILYVASTISQILDVAKLITNETGWGAVIMDAIAAVYEVVKTCFLDNSKEYTNTVFYNADLNSSNALPLQFKNVEVISGYGGIGRTIFEYTSDDDYPVWEPSNTAHSQKQRYAPWAYGLLKKETVYKKNDDGKLQKVNEIQNVYDYTGQIKFCGGHYINCALKVKRPLYNFSSKSYMKKNVSQKSDDWENEANYSEYIKPVYDAVNTSLIETDDLIVENYDVYTGRAELLTSYSRDFDDKGTMLETETDYTYNSGEQNDNNYDVNSITTKKSNGDKETKEIYYNSDYGFSNIEPYASMIHENILSVPLQTNTSIFKASDETTSYIDSKATSYESLQLLDGSTVFKPWKKMETRFKEPGGVNFFYQDDPESSGFTVTQTYSYDKSGNLTGLKDEGGHVVTNKYGYNDKFVVGTIINADPNKDPSAYTSFETDLDFDTWIVQGTHFYNSDLSVTGNRSMSLHSGVTITSPTLNIEKPYRLSLWSTERLHVDGAGDPVVQTQGLNGFTYYEYNIPMGTSEIRMYGTSAYIDELRLYPANARMRTVSYDPLIGKTAECDENNRLTYYEYDNLGRLQFVKDENKHILKMNEYNIVSKQSGCPTAYYNNYIQEVITKDDCGAGFISGKYVYKIAPRTYTSTISQADADAQAEEELLTQGQAKANQNAVCYKIFYNRALSQNFPKQSCDDGWIGSNVTYVVPAGRYPFVNYQHESDEAAQAEADQLAQDEIDANGQSYANQQNSGTCTIDPDPDWEVIGEPQYDCRNGQQYVLVTDINPNSSTNTYNQTDWKPTGNDADCDGHYSLTRNQSDCDGTTSSSFTLRGKSGDVVQLKLTFSGSTKNDGATTYGSGAMVVLNNAGTASQSKCSPNYSTSYSVSYNINCVLTFTMFSDHVTIDAVAELINNADKNSTPLATLQIVSVNGAPVSVTEGTPCITNTNGSW